MSIRYIPLILSGIIIVIGVNTALAIRDSRMWNRLEERNEVIYKQLEVVPYSPQ
tara:strand:- start:49 stop:210 length:162 start_codon:yes stop_codon:yes gene_type:complete